MTTTKAVKQRSAKRQPVKPVTAKPRRKNAKSLLEKMFTQFQLQLDEFEARVPDVMNLEKETKLLCALAATLERLNTLGENVAKKKTKNSRTKNMQQSPSSGEASFARFVTGLKSLHNRTDLKQKIKTLADALTNDEAEFLLHDWCSWARAEQLPPQGDWTTWLFMGGRGAGKTRAGAEWVRCLATGPEPLARIALIGETLNDARDVMVEGESGILAVHRRDQRPVYEKTRGRLVWSNGVQAQIFSADVPDSLRGPQFHAAWCDEIAKWRYMQNAFDNLQFGLRLGKHPRQMITTTPRNMPLLKKLAADKRNVVTRATTQANSNNLPQVFIEEIMSRYGGTRLGRQELDGEIIEDRNDALWTRQMIDTARVTEAPQMTRIVVALDPAVTSHEKSDACGIVAAGTGEDGHAYILEDATMRAVRPDVWADRAIAMYQRLSSYFVGTGGQHVNAKGNKGAQCSMAGFV